MSQLPVRLAAAGTNATADEYARIPGSSIQDYKVVQAEVTDWGGVAADATDYIDVIVKKNTTTLETVTTSTTALTALTADTLSDVVGKVVSGGDYIHLDVNKAGTGPTYDLELLLMLEPVNLP